MVRRECIECGHRAGWIGIAANTLLVVLKATVGIAAGSKVCLADALHSGTNIAGAIAVLVSRKLVGKPVDEQHPYGYGKVEFLAATIVSSMVVVVGLVLIGFAIKHLVVRPAAPAHWTALCAAVISIGANELLFRFFRCAGTELRSQSLMANVWANRANSLSSFLVIGGVVGAQVGFPYLDPIAAIIVSAIIIKIAVGSIRESACGLLDRSVPEETLRVLRAAVEEVDEVARIEHLRARLLGDRIWVEISVQVVSRCTVTECERIRGQIQRRVASCVRGVGRVLVDFEPVPEPCA